MPRKLISERQPDGCRKGLGEEGRVQRRELATYFRQRTSVYSQKEGTGAVVGRSGRGARRRQARGDLPAPGSDIAATPDFSPVEEAAAILARSVAAQPFRCVRRRPGARCWTCQPAGSRAFWQSLQASANRRCAMGQARKTFVIEVPAARVAAALSLLEIGNIARHNFARSAEESEALHEIAEQMRMQLLAQGAQEAGTASVTASA